MTDKAVQALREIYEVWAWAEGFVPETAPEAYQKQLIEEMRDIAAEALKELTKVEASNE